MTMPLDVRQCIRRMDADGAGPTEIARALGTRPQHRCKVREHGGPVARAAARAREGEARDRPARRLGPRGARRVTPGPAEAAPCGEEDLRQTRRGGGLHRILCDGPRARAGVEAGAEAVAWRWLPRARLGAGDHAGRPRQPRRYSRGQGPRARAARGHAPAIEVEVLRGNEVREGGVSLRGARRDLRARWQGAARDGARQRDRGRSDALRKGDRVAAVLADEGSLPLRVEVPRPPLGKREGVRRERRRLPSQEPPRPGSVRRVRGRARREAVHRLRAHQLHLP